MLGIGGFEFFIILLFAFLILGPDKLPEAARKIGKFIARFRDVSSEINTVAKKDLYHPEAEDPFENTVEGLEKIGKVASSAVMGEMPSDRQEKYKKDLAQQIAQEKERKSARGTFSPVEEVMKNSAHATAPASDASVSDMSASAASHAAVSASDASGAARVVVVEEEED